MIFLHGFVGRFINVASYTDPVREVHLAQL